MWLAELHDQFEVCLISIFGFFLDVAEAGIHRDQRNVLDHS